MSGLQLIFKSFALILLFLVCASAQVGDACEGQRCLRFYNAECRNEPENCDAPPCISFFFRGRNVTDRCDVDRCDEKSCNKNRQCMEEVVSLSCTSDPSNCRQYLKARCAQIVIDRPMTCNDVKCGAKMGCRMRIRENLPPVVRCIPVERESNCNNIQCDGGFTCVDKGSTVSCVADTTTPSGSGDDSGTTSFLTTTETMTPEATTPTSMPEATTPETTTSTPTAPEVTIPESTTSPQTTTSTPTTREVTTPVTTTSTPTTTEATTPESTSPETTTSTLATPASSSPETTTSAPTTPSRPMSCEPRCADHERCVRFPGIGLGCIDAIFGLTCDELRCPPEAPSCSFFTVPDLNDSTIAQCTQEETIMSIEQTLLSITNKSCKNFGEACEELDLTCVDVLQGEANTAFYCTSFNCTEEGCEPENACTNIPEELFDVINAVINADSACVPENFTTEFGRSCATTSCDPGMTCSQTEIGDLVGSYCMPGSSPHLPCKEITCFEANEICIENTFPTKPGLRLASCATASDIAFLLALLDPSGVSIVVTEKATEEPTSHDSSSTTGSGMLSGMGP